MMENDGAYRLEPSTDPAYDYRFFIRNLYGFYFDLDEREDRERLAATVLGDQCPNLAVLSETATETGVYPLTGSPAILYDMRVTCE